VRSFFFPLLKKAEQWLGGAKIRLTGNRQNTSFRTAPMSADQRSLFPAAG
jgi:hypothetical protein